MIYDSEKYKTETLKVLLERYNADRAYIFRFNEQEQTSTRICEVVAEGITPDKKVNNKNLSGAYNHFKKGLPIYFSREEDLANSPTLQPESILIIKKHGIQSCLLVPVLVSGRLWGYLGADTIKKARKWTQIDVEYMQAIAGVLAVTLGSNEKDDVINAFNKIRGRQLLQYEDKFRNILAVIPLALVLYSRNGDYLECNNAMLKMFGYKSFQEVKKANLFTFDPEIASLTKKEPYQIEMAYNVAGRKLYKNIADLPFSPELKYISIKIFSLDYDTTYVYPEQDNISCTQNRNGYLLLATEIQNHLLAEEIPAAKPESGHTRSSFMANIGHEFITPLNAIIGFSELISLSQNQTERNMFYEIVENNRSQLINLIDELAEYSKIESGRMTIKKETVNLRDVFIDLIGQLKAQHGNRIHVHYPQSNKQEPVHIQSNRESIYKIFSNILNNMIKNMLQGNITISHCTDEMDEYGKTLIFSIKTPDLIIPPDKISSIFKKYTKLNEDAMGLDIGLVITKSLVEHLQGTITVSSREKNGTEFMIALPLECPEKEYGARTDNTTTNIHPSHHFENFIQDGAITNDEYNVQGENNMEEKRLDILLAEDIDFNYMLVNAIIGKKHNLTRARTGKEAVELFQKNKYHLILMDIKMPEMDGITATKLIREIDKEIPIIAVTAYAFDADKQVALEAGCNSYIVKPIDSKTLNSAIQQAAGMDYNKNL